tara:strand:+ start:150 stop:443 length:294 start_codon:yes stop_codon:yes gene_type:complete
MFVDNLRLDVIATFEDNEQEHFSCAIWKSAIKSEKKLIDYVKEQLNHKDLVKLSLCWLCDENIVKKYPTIQKSIKKNAKYYFGSWAEQRKEKRDEKT